MTLFLIVRWKNIAITLSTKSLILLRRGHLCNLLKFVCSITTPHTLRATCSRSKNFEESSLKFHDSQFAHSFPSWPISFQKRCLFINTFDSIDIVSSLLRDKGMREKNPRDGINEIRLIKGATVPKERTVAACYAPFRRLTLFKGL